MKYILIFNGYPKSGKTTIQNEILNKYPNSYIYSSIKPVIEFLDNIILRVEFIRPVTKTYSM